MAYYDFAKYRVPPGREEEGSAAIRDYPFYPYKGHIIHEPQRFHTYGMCSDNLEGLYDAKNSPSTWGDWNAIESDESFAMAEELKILSLNGNNYGGTIMKFASFDCDPETIGNDFQQSLGLPHIWERTSFGPAMDDWGVRNLRAGKPVPTGQENYWRHKLGLPLLKQGR